MTNKTIYQRRYEAHQKRKAAQLEYGLGEAPKTAPEGVWDALRFRRSQRLFTNEPVDVKTLLKLYQAAAIAPSSCDRHGVSVQFVVDRYEKNLLGGLLVGGAGWVHRAQAIYLLLADPKAYASPNEKDFMHYLDAGFLAMSMWLAAEQEGLGAAFINPNVTDRDVMADKFTGEYIFCGALAVGKYERRVKEAPRIKPFDLVPEHEDII